MTITSSLADNNYNRIDYKVSDKNHVSAESKILGEKPSVSDPVGIEKSFERMTSDATRVALSSKLRTNVEGLSSETQGIQENVTMIQSIDSTLEKIESALQKMQVIAVQADDTALREEDMRFLDTRMKHLKAEIDRFIYSM